jgi:ABC-type Fe3+/spermidine/putrescine transport system ATPase subunit
VGVVFQSYALWPHMDVAGNVAYPLRVAGIAEGEMRRRVDQALETVGLSGLGARRPADLSGGQRQRVALARCLVMEPSLVLLDEPLANLDTHLRGAMQREFDEYHRRTGTTMLYITHDQAEAMALADRVAVMSQGRLVQLAPPSRLYREPATRMVAEFIGHASVLDCDVLSATDAGRAAQPPPACGRTTSPSRPPRRAPATRRCAASPIAAAPSRSRPRPTPPPMRRCASWRRSPSPSSLGRGSRSRSATAGSSRAAERAAAQRRRSG